MNVTEVSQLIDRLIFEHTGKHLDDVQTAIVEGTWQGQTYEEIGQECKRTKNHVRDVGYQLWQLLSEALGQDIKKSNFRSNLERFSIKSSQNICIGTNHNFNFNSSTLTDIDKKYKINHKNLNTSSSYIDLTIAPKIINFYDRETELKKLTNWIVNQNTRLISVLGLFGIGKTTLVKRFVDLNLQQFEVIIWRSLQFPQSLNLLLDDLLNIVQQEIKETPEGKLRQLLDFFIRKKCLIIFDDIQTLFMEGQYSGQYKSEYQDYQNFFKMITEINHQSHVILISQESCSEMHCPDERVYPVKCLQLSGIENIKLLKNQGLKYEYRWLDLIKLYEGHPVYLKDIASLLKDVYSGNVSEFLAENHLIITKMMQYYFQQLFNRLSPQEQKLLLELSQYDNPVAREQLKQKLDLSPSDFINSLQSLQQRYLVKKIDEDKTLFNLSPVLREYLKYWGKDYSK